MLEAKHTKFGDPNFITMVFDFLSLKKQKTSLKAPKIKKYIFFTFFPHILLYFALEAKHTKFGDPNLIILSFDFLSLKKSKNVPKKPPK